MQQNEPPQIPQHLAIIMDGNRRWAKARDLSSTQGHEAGVDSLVEIINHCEKLGVKIVTLYTLSTENWRERSKEEVAGIFGLLVRLVKEKKAEYAKRGIRVGVLGDVSVFPSYVRSAIQEIMGVSPAGENMRVNFALNYGGRDELVRATQAMIRDGVRAEDVNEKMVADYLYTKGQSDPELVIRTGGERRLSNFLLWQLSYSEMYFTDVLWPDFSPAELDKAFADFMSRQRRFGK